MYKLVIAALVVVLHVSLSTAQGGQSLVPQTMTAAELWNPFSWYYPFGIAAANAWSDYLQNAQQATNQLYQHIQAVSNPAQQAPGQLNNAVPSVTTPKTSDSATTMKPEAATTQKSEASTTQKPQENA